MIDRKDFLSIGTIGRAHGYDGSIRINLSDTVVFRKKLNTKEPVFFETEGYLVPFFFDKISVSDSQIIIHPEDWKSENDSRDFIGVPVFMSRKFVADEQEEQNELLGYMICDEEKRDIGEITGIEMQGTHALLTVQNNGKTHLIPFAEPLIVSVDHITKRIVLSLPEGILDL